MQVIFFETPTAFRAWLEANHETATELWVGFHKKATGRPSMAWSEAVDQALCFGWIDGIRKSVDADSYANRFTPRKPRSTWSNVNIAKMERLTEQLAWNSWCVVGGFVFGGTAVDGITPVTGGLAMT